MRFFYALIFCLLFSIPSRSQNITGSWEGMMDGEVLQINIVQKGNELCGYTYDYEIEDSVSFCRAYFSGIYDKERNEWMISGTSFYQNSGSHVLMRIRLWRSEDNPFMLEGMQYPKAIPGTLSLIMGGTPLSLRKMSSRPVKLPNGKDPCPQPEKISRNGAPDPRDLAKNKKMPVPVSPQKKPPVTARNTPKKPAPVTAKPPVKNNTTVVTKPPVTPQKKTVPVKPPVVPQKTTVTAKSKPTVKPQVKQSPPVVAKPPVQKKDTAAVILPPPLKNDPPVVVTPPLKVTERANKEIRTLQVNVRTITLKVYDNGTVDGDTVSIYYDGKLLVDKKGLTVKPIELTIEVDEHSTKHELVMYAENLGSIPPNTALIVVTAGDKRYELFASSSLKENAVLVFEYKPGD